MDTEKLSKYKCGNCSERMYTPHITNKSYVCIACQQGVMKLEGTVEVIFIKEVD